MLVRSTVSERVPNQGIKRHTGPVIRNRLPVALWQRVLLQEDHRIGTGCRLQGSYMYDDLRKTGPVFRVSLPAAVHQLVSEWRKRGTFNGNRITTHHPLRRTSHPNSSWVFPFDSPCSVAAAIRWSAPMDMGCCPALEFHRGGCHTTTWSTRLSRRYVLIMTYLQ